MSISFEILLKLKESLTRPLDKIEGKFRQSVKNIKSSWNSLITLPNIVAGAAPVLMAKNLVQASMEMEAIEAKMKAALPTFGAAGREINFISEESDRLGLNLQKTIGEYATFVASTTRTGLSVKKTRQIFSDMSEALIALKAPANRVTLVFQALTQMSGKGVVSMEELRRQLGDSLPAAVAIGARAMNMTTQAFIKAVGQGEIMSRDFLPKFAKQVKQELGGSFDTASQQMQASLNRMLNAWFKFRVNLGKLISEGGKGPLDSITEKIKLLNDNFSKVKAGILGIIAPLETLRQGFMIGIDTLKYFAEAATTIIPSIGYRLMLSSKNITDSLKSNLESMKVYFSALKKAITTDISLKDALREAEILSDEIKDAYGAKIKARKSLIEGEKEAVDKQLTEYLVNLVDSTDNRFEKIAQAWANLAVQIEKSSLEPPKGKTTAVEGKIITEETGGESEKERKKRLARLKKLLDEEKRLTGIRAREEQREITEKIKYRDKMQKLFQESQEIYERARIDSLENNYQREFELLDLKYAKEREKFKENTDALMNIERAYSIERKTLEKEMQKFQRDSMKSWVDTVTSSLMTIAGENKEFTEFYKAAAIIQIIADTYQAATAAYRSMVDAYGAYGIPAGIAAAAVVTAAGLANAAAVADLKFAYGTRSFRTNGPQMMLVGDNPGGIEEVNVKPVSSQNVNGPRTESTGNLILHIHDNSGAITETFRRKIREGGGMDTVIRDIFGRASALGVV